MLLKITDNIKYLGVNDTRDRLFEGQFEVPNGIKYNSYMIIDEKIAIIDTIAEGFTEKWLENVEKELCGREPDYLVVLHMEPDHSFGIYELTKKYPNMKIVSSKKSFDLMKGFFDTDFSQNGIAVGEGQSLCLGKHVLEFINAPMVHWPEVIMAYENTQGILFSADAFGKFGTDNEVEEWADEARRYYFGIVGKYGKQVGAVLKKLSKYEIKKICPLHGTVLEKNLDYYVNLYDTWSSYRYEENGVFIAYNSVYGNTEKAAYMLFDILLNNGIKVKIIDISSSECINAIDSAFRYKYTVFCATTYNNGLFPSMREFVTDLFERCYQNRRVGIIENGSWAPTASKALKNVLNQCENITFFETEVRIFSSLNSDSKSSLASLTNEIICDIKESNIL